MMNIRVILSTDVEIERKVLDVYGKYPDIEQRILDEGGRRIRRVKIADVATFPVPGTKKTYRVRRVIPIDPRGKWVVEAAYKDDTDKARPIEERIEVSGYRDGLAFAALNHWEQFEPGRNLDKFRTEYVLDGVFLLFDTFVVPQRSPTYLEFEASRLKRLLSVADKLGIEHVHLIARGSRWAQNHLLKYSEKRGGVFVYVGQQD